MVNGLRILTFVLFIAAVTSFPHAMLLFYKRFRDSLLSTLPFSWWEWPLYALPLLLLICAGACWLVLRRVQRANRA